MEAAESPQIATLALGSAIGHCLNIVEDGAIDGLVGLVNMALSSQLRNKPYRVRIEILRQMGPSGE